MSDAHRVGFLALATCFAALACSSLLRYPTEEPPRDLDEAKTLGERMNRDVLSLDRFDRLVVEVDWVETAAPADMALTALLDTLVEFAPEGYEITLERSGPIPYEEWEAVKNDLIPLKLVKDHANPPREQALVRLYVLYLPELPEEHPGQYGYFAPLEITWNDSEDSPRFSMIVLSKGSFRRNALLWLRPEQIERGTLVHELGHFLGLVSNPRHEVRDDPGHCANPACVMSHPRWRSILRNTLKGLLGQLPYEYGDECRRDIEIAKRWWALPEARSGGYVAQRHLNRGIEP